MMDIEKRDTQNVEAPIRSSDGEEIGPCPLLASTISNGNGSCRPRRATRSTRNSEEILRRYHNEKQLNELGDVLVSSDSSSSEDGDEYPDTDADARKSMTSKSLRIEKKRLSANPTHDVVTDLWQASQKERLSWANEDDSDDDEYNAAALNANDITSEDDCDDKPACSSTPPLSNQRGRGKQQAINSKVRCHGKRTNPPRARSRDELSKSEHSGNARSRSRDELSKSEHSHVRFRGHRRDDKLSKSGRDELSKSEHSSQARSRSRDVLSKSEHSSHARSRSQDELSKSEHSHVRSRGHRRDDKLSNSEHNSVTSGRSCHYPVSSSRRVKRGDSLSTRSEHSSCSRPRHHPSGGDQLTVGSQHNSVSRSRQSRARSSSISPERQASRSLSPVILKPPSGSSSSGERALSYSLAKMGLQKNWDFAVSQALINLAREDAGLKLMSKNEEMNDLAQACAHRIANGESAMQKAQYQGHVLRGTTIPSIHQKVMEQEAGRTRANILNPNFEEFGTGTAAGKDGQIYICHLFKGSLFDLDCNFLDSSPSTTDMPEKRGSPSPSTADATHKDLRGRLMLGSLDAGNELGAKMIPGKKVGITVLSSTFRKTLKKTFSSEGLPSILKRASSSEGVAPGPSRGILKRSFSAEGMPGMNRTPSLSSEVRPSRPTRRNQVC